ncbi:MAG: MoaD family protein [Nitrososphaerota archaeon]|jgi:molybdopterin synthase sulfur carrier subunit|nr:MoaD family protein [Nitrososphaerota archaeon]
MISVYISGHLKDYVGSKSNLEMPVSRDVTMLMDELSKLFPGIKDRIFDDQDRTRPFVNIFVNGINIRDSGGESTRLKEGDKVHILPSIAGG